MVRLLLLMSLILSSAVVFAGQGMINGHVFDDPTGPWSTAKPVMRTAQQAKVSIPNLQAIFVRDNTRIAIMNDQEVQAGSWVSGYQVRRISDDFVYFTRHGKEFRLSVFANKIKQ